VKLTRTLVALAVLVGLSGCETIGEWFDDEDYDPTAPVELTDINETVVLDKRWSRSVGNGQGDGLYRLNPLLADGVIYAVSEEGELAAFDADSGKLRWESELEIPISGGVGKYRDSLLLGGADGLVMRLSAEDGSEIWRQPVTGEVLAAPQSNGQVVVAQAYDGKLMAFDYETGDKLWTFSNDVPVLTLRGTSTPIIYNDFVIAGFADGKVIAVSLDSGSVVWEARVAIAQGVLRLSESSISTARWRFKVLSFMWPAIRGESSRWKCEQAASYGSVMFPQYPVYP